MRPYALHVLKRFEIYLALGGAAFVAVVYWLFEVAMDTGLIVAVTVVGMATIQGAIQWADRERSARLRQRQIHEIREMLRDQVLNQLSAVKVWLAEPPDPDSVEILFEELNDSVDGIATLIDQLSESQLNTWKLTYANAADNITMTGAPLDAMPTQPTATPGVSLRRPTAPRGQVPDVDALIEAVGLPPTDVQDLPPGEFGTMIVRADPTPAPPADVSEPAPSDAPTKNGPTVAAWH